VPGGGGGGWVQGGAAFAPMTERGRVRQAPACSTTMICLLQPAHTCRVRMRVTRQGKAPPQQLLRVGSTLYRRALSFSITSPRARSVIRRLEGDGMAQLADLQADSMEQVRRPGERPPRTRSGMHAHAALARHRAVRGCAHVDSCACVRVCMCVCVCACCAFICRTQGKACSPRPPSRMSLEGTVCVDVQLVLPPHLKAPSPAAAAAAADASSVAAKLPRSHSPNGSSSSSSSGGRAAHSTALAPPGAAAAAAGAGRATPAPCCSCCTPPGKPVLSTPPGTACAGAAIVAAAAAAAAAADEDEGLCTICYDAPATCVLMECGHGGYCWRCAHVLFARPPSECPVCRQRIMQVRARRVCVCMLACLLAAARQWCHVMLPQMSARRHTGLLPLSSAHPTSLLPPLSS
jgi:hypothetical protein